MKIPLISSDEYESVFCQQEETRRRVFSAQAHCALRQLRIMPYRVVQELRQFQDPEAVRKMWWQYKTEENIQLPRLNQFEAELSQLPRRPGVKNLEMHHLIHSIVLTRDLGVLRMKRLGLYDVQPMLMQGLEELIGHSVPSKEGTLYPQALDRKKMDDFVLHSIAFRETRMAQLLMELVEPEPTMRGTPRQSMPDNRRFGVELEGFLPSLATRHEQREYVFHHLEKAGIKVQRGCTTPGGEPAGWTIKDDETVLNPFIHSGHRVRQDDWQPHYFDRFDNKMFQHVSLEIITPPLRGEEGASELFKGMHMLREIGMRANSCCQNHIHAEIPGRNIEEARNLGRWFIENESKLDQHIEERARGSTGPMSRSNAAQYHGGLDEAQTLKEVVTLISPNRRFKLNMTNLIKSDGEPTGEYRARQGGFDPIGMTNYTSLVVSCTDGAARGLNPGVPAYVPEVATHVRTSVLSITANQPDRAETPVLRLQPLSITV